MSQEYVNEELSGAVAVALRASMVPAGMIDGGLNDIEGIAGTILTVRYCVQVFPLPYVNVEMTVFSSLYTGNSYDMFIPVIVWPLGKDQDIL